MRGLRQRPENFRMNYGHSLANGLVWSRTLSVAEIQQIVADGGVRGKRQEDRAQNQIARTLKIGLDVHVPFVRDDIRVPIAGAVQQLQAQGIGGHRQGLPPGCSQICQFPGG